MPGWLAENGQPPKQRLGLRSAVGLLAVQDAANLDGVGSRVDEEQPVAAESMVERSPGTNLAVC